MPKGWPTDPSFRAFKAPANGFLKADCSELVFKSVFLDQAGSTFSKKNEKRMKQNKNARKNACCSLDF